MPVNIKHFDPHVPKDCGFNKNDIDFFDLQDDLKRLQTMVFSPDPNTGNPCSEIAILLSGSDPAFQQFIKDKLMQPQASGLLADSADEAAALVHKNLMTSEQYANYVCEYVVNQSKRE